MTPEAGRAWPLGAHVVDRGVNFAVFSAHAEALALCLFDASGAREVERIAMRREGDVWHAFLPGAGPGLVYAYRAHGRWAPDEGHRFDATKPLLDPAAREIVTPPDTREGLRARVVADLPSAPAEARPQRPLARSVIYEAHVKGFTQRHPGVPAALRGTYAGLASDAAIEHLLRLGVTAVSLLPIQQHLDEPRLRALGLSNYWGYNTIGFFAVEPGYASGHDGMSAREEFRAMVRRLHDAGLEVILDIVFNHTAEGDLQGPTLSWRGLDNRSWYRALPGAPAVYDNLAGCGNALDVRHPRVLQFVMDSLRYWAGTMNVDGFRFDLAPVMARGDAGFDAGAPIFHAIAQDPLLAGRKLIAEPWDVGPGGYRLGEFPLGWAEWNDRFRDGVRRYWLGGDTHRGDFARRLCASADVFHRRGRAPSASVNYVVAHDGFTLLDLLTFSHRQNQANGEHNRDGHTFEHGWNCGVDGPNGDAQVLELRARLQRTLLATLLLAQGTPMLAAGAELGHTQHGNNNAYCQDNETSWIDWDGADAALVDFTARLIALRRELEPLHEDWYRGELNGSGVHDIAWRRADGAGLDNADWHDPRARTLAILLDGRWLLLVNAEAGERAFALPPGNWQLRIDSAHDTHTWQGARSFALAGHALALLARMEVG
jgi:glycogen debranching enzyme